MHLIKEHIQTVFLLENKIYLCLYRPFKHFVYTTDTTRDSENLVLNCDGSVMPASRGEEG